ncbi:hypothetical protein BU14_0151s0009 [Porphyra umbilicalis]|uniref:Uncharacterized protein n=1 Tax=Porphyra umbilicalis TaxID=2786 RepID=A0A1X6P958_PORUM|nr:hypothetical protein BU14_0151s0009 [Porphyra umbilicalis]|eukprot:OSX77367.1 hypothetical protein BU14_0151s0009 [Porphyra umbilicalis]
MNAVTPLRVLTVALLTGVLFGSQWDDASFRRLLRTLERMGEVFLTLVPLDAPGTTVRAAKAAPAEVRRLLAAEIDLFVTKQAAAAAAAAAMAAAAGGRGAGAPRRSSSPLRGSPLSASLLLPPPPPSPPSPPPPSPTPPSSPPPSSPPPSSPPPSSPPPSSPPPSSPPPSSPPPSSPPPPPSSPSPTLSSPPRTAAKRSLLVMRPLSEAETAQLRHICPSVLSPDRLVRYAEHLRITCPGGTLEPGDLNNHDVVGASMDALMEAGDLQHHMLKDKVNCCSKRSFIVGMRGTTDDQTLAHVRGAWMKSHPTFKKWLEAGLAKLTSCRSSQHDRGIMCTRCDTFPALRARQLGDNVVAHQAGPRLWGEDDYKAVISATRGAPH